MLIFTLHLSRFLEDFQQQVDNILKSEHEKFNQSFTPSFIKSEEQKIAFDKHVMTKINTLKQLITQINQSQQEFINQLNAKTGGKSICNSNVQPALKQDSYFNNHNVNRDTVRSTKNISENCTDLTSDGTILQLFKNLLFSSEFFDENSPTSFNRYSTVHYYDLKTYAQFQYPYATFQDSAPNESPEVLLDKMRGDFYGDEIVVLFPCLKNEVNQQQIYQLNPRIQTEQIYDFNASASQYLNQLLSQQLLSITTNIPKAVVCFTNSSYFSFAESFTPKFNVEEAIARFIDKEYNNKTDVVNIENIFNIISSIILEREESYTKRIYNFYEPLVFKSPTNKYRDPVLVKQKPLQIVIQDMEIMQVKSQVDTLLKKYPKVSAASMMDQNVIVCFFHKKNTQYKFPLSLYFRQIQSTQAEFKIDNISKVIHSETFQNSLLQQFIIKPQFKDVFQQNVFQLCSQVTSTKTDEQFGIVCNNVPIDQIFHLDYLNDKLINYYLINKATESVVFQTNTQNTIDYKYFVNRFSDAQILHLYTNKYSMIETDDAVYFSGQITGIYQLIVEIPAYQYKSMFKINTDTHSLSDHVKELTTKPIDIGKICYN